MACKDTGTVMLFFCFEKPPLEQ